MFQFQPETAMKGKTESSSFRRTSIRSLLILTALVACFFAGRASQEKEIERLNTRLNQSEELRRLTSASNRIRLDTLVQRARLEKDLDATKSKLESLLNRN